jgi:hypothetical protein
MLNVFGREKFEKVVKSVKMTIFSSLAFFKMGYLHDHLLHFSETTKPWVFVLFRCTPWSVHGPSILYWENVELYHIQLNVVHFLHQNANKFNISMPIQWNFVAQRPALLY